MTGAEIARRRLAQQHLLEPAATTLSGLVAWMGAVQAQDYAGAKWAVGQRTRGATDAALDAALADGSIVRTHLLRPTWHFVAAADLRWMLALTGPRVHAGCASRYRELGLDGAELRRGAEIMARALAGGRELTRAELGEALERAGIETRTPQRLVYLLMAAELDGVICSGARRGRHFTYALVDERVPAAAPLSREEALRELARRYFATRGPATLRDFSWWSGLTVADARRGARAAELARAEVEGEERWFVPGPAPAVDGSHRAHLLPSFDEFSVGLRDRGAMVARLLADASAPSVPPGALIANLVTIDGQVVGSWRRTLRRGSVVVGLTAWVELATAEKRAVEAEVQRYGAFHGLVAEPVW